MKRIRIVGLCLMAVMAVSAVAAASSSATLPEFEATGGLPATFTSTNSSNLLPTLHSSVLESVVNCTETKDSGEISGATVVSKIKVLYSGCKEGTSSNKCGNETGAASGNILTKELNGRIGYIAGHLTEKLVGTELEPSSGTVFAEFTCEGAAGKVTVEGCTIGEAKPINKLQNTGSLLFWENATLTGQLYTLIDEKTEKTRHPCEQTVTASILKLKGKGWLMDDELETFSKNVILNA